MAASRMARLRARRAARRYLLNTKRRASIRFPGTEHRRIDSGAGSLEEIHLVRRQ